MKIKEAYKETTKILDLVLSKRKYKLISLISGIVIFGFLYYFLVASVANNDIWIAVMMSGEAFITFSIITGIITAGLSGILISLTLFKFLEYKKVEGKGIFGFIGSGMVALGTGCPTCGAFLFGLLGMPLALIYFPFSGLELQVLGILILIISIYFTSKSIKGYCKVPKRFRKV